MRKPVFVGSHQVRHHSGCKATDPHYNGLNDELQNVQKRAASLVMRNYSHETESMTGILEELKWETLQKWRKDKRLIFNTVQRSER